MLSEKVHHNIEVLVKLIGTDGGDGCIQLLGVDISQDLAAVRAIVETCIVGILRLKEVELVASVAVNSIESLPITIALLSIVLSGADLRVDGIDLRLHVVLAKAAFVECLVRLASILGPLRRLH